MRRIRTKLRLNYTELSERLQDVAGWSINAVGIRRIESGERRVTPDDLMALAFALGVSPITLLMPDYDTLDKNDLVEVTGCAERVPAHRLWDWLRARQTLNHAYQDMDPYYAFITASEPRWIRLRRDEVFGEEMKKVRAKLFQDEELSDGDD